MGSFNDDPNPRATLIEFDNTVLRQLLEEETKLWLQKLCHVSNCGLGEGSRAISPHNDATNLLRHSKQLKDIHGFFKTLTPPRYLNKLQGQMEQDFQVIDQMDRNNKILFTGTQTTTITYKETSKPLSFEEKNMYKCALIAALYPVCPPLENSSNNHQIDQEKSSNRPQDPSVTPNSKECMLYDKDPISPSSIFPIDPDNLTELVRRAFGLTQRRHGVYVEEVEKQLAHDPAMVKEMNDYLVVLKNGCHTFFQPNAFSNRNCYNTWHEIETMLIENMIKDQEDLVNEHCGDFVKPTCQTVPLNFKDKHPWYKKLLAKLYRLESVNSRMNVVTNEPVPTGPLSAESSQLLNEFGERYRVGEIYRRISLLEYLARNFETKQWYCKHVASVIKSVLNNVNTELGNYILKEEIKMFQNAVTVLRDHVEHVLTRINRMFPRNSPEGGLQSVLALLTVLFDVDKNIILSGEQFLFEDGTLPYYLKKYLKEEMCTNYEAQKIKIASQINMFPYFQHATPRMINLIILGIIEMVRNYRMYYKKGFQRYFDIVQTAVEVFYSLLMQDVHDLCNTEQQLDDIDYPMIALAYKLSSLDREHVWENNLTIDKQTWREPFLKRSLSWINSLHNNLQSLVLKALQQDNWQTLALDDTTYTELTTSQKLLQRTGPQDIVKHDTSPVSRTRNTAVTSIAPSANSAFVQVNSRSAVPNISSETGEHSQQPAASTTTNISPRPQVDDITSRTKTGASKGNPRTMPHLFADSSIPHHLKESSVSSLPDSYQSAASSIGAQFSDECFEDACSHFDDDDDDDDDDVDDPVIVERREIRVVPVSSSLVDTICVLNRMVATVTHISHVLCPKQTRKIHDSLRLTPDDQQEVEQRLETGRARLASELSIMVDLAVSFYGYYSMLAESYGMTDDSLKSIIGESCFSKFRDLSQSLRDDDHHTADNGIFIPTSLKAEIAKTVQDPEIVTTEMCIRMNNVRTLKDILGSLIETAVDTLVYTDVMKGDREETSSPGSSQDTASPSASLPRSEEHKILNNDSIALTVLELQELVDGLAKILAYRANITIHKLLQLVSTLNLRCFGNRKLLRPVLKATKRTIEVFANNLYHDCFTLVIRYFWLAIVKDFEIEKENLLFLNGDLRDKVNLLLDALSYFIEIFRSENIISLTFISNSVEPVIQSLNLHLLTTSDLTGIYGGLQTRNENIDVERKTNIYRCYPPSGRLIARLRIELHSEHAYFTGTRFVECVADKIRSSGNLSLGICAMQNASDEQSAGNLGRYLLENEVITFIGKTVQKPPLRKSCEDGLDEELEKYTQRGSVLIVPGGKAPHEIVNGVCRFKSSIDTESDLSRSSLDINVIEDHNDGQSACFINSKEVLYKFKLLDVEESCDVEVSPSHTYLEEQCYVRDTEHKRQDDIIRVLFTRRNVDKEASDFLSKLQDNEVLQELFNQYSLSQYSLVPKCCTNLA